MALELSKVWSGMGWVTINKNVSRDKNVQNIGD